MKINFFNSTHYRSPKPNIYLLKKKRRTSLKWMIGQFAFMLWIPYTRLTKRNFSQTFEETKKAVGRKGFSGNTLDIGGGHGGFSELWQPDTADDLYFIADPLFRKTITELPKYKENKIIYVQAYGEKLPFNNGSFDTIIIAATLDHMDKPDNSISEAERILKNKGRIFILQKVESKKVSYISGHAHTFSRRDLTSLIEKKFKIEQTSLSIDKQVMYIWAVKNGA